MTRGHFRQTRISTTLTDMITCRRIYRAEDQLNRNRNCVEAAFRVAVSC